jgi:poly [ADP-ribose] polymerase
MLLWHGSRVSNFGGILSQGMRIAPPEAPASGYLFGKGIYLADMAEKSINYCRSYGQPTALILLLEVLFTLSRVPSENPIFC